MFPNSWSEFEADDINTEELKLQKFIDKESDDNLSSCNKNAGDCYSSVPSWMKAYFWDVDISELDVTENRNYIITRLLSLGDQYTLKWVFDTYKRDAILDIVKHSRGLLLKTAIFWKSYFNLNESDMRCFKVFDDMKDLYSF